MTGVKEVTLLDAAAEQPKALAVPDTGAVAMFERLARDPSVDVDKLERLIAMQERIIRHNAEASFNAAFSQMLPEVPTIIERAHADKFKYAPLEDIVEPLRPVLARHGFSVSFRTEWPDPKTVKVIGILTHSAGHSRQSEFMSAADTSGSKNAIQALGSAVMYGKRYTINDLLCIVTRGSDDDGRRATQTGKDAPPEGYGVFVDVLRVAAMNGKAAFSKAFNDGAQPLRAYLTSRDTAEWDSLKKAADKAATVKAGGK